MVQQFINSFLERINSKATTVALNISSRSILEIVEFDKNGLITNYASVPIQYNSFTKELENINDFESGLKTAFSELGLSLSSRVYVSIPTSIIENETLPMMDGDDEIKSVLTASAERNYIFKKYDPTIGFFRLPPNEDDPGSLNVTYTALRSDEYGKLLSIFEAMGMKVAAIDSSYSSLINGVIATQKVNTTILDSNAQWNIINITSNSFTIFAMKGRYLTDVYEEPLAVKSFTEEEIYQVITNSLDLVLDKYPAQQMVIVSQSDNVSAEYLASTLEIDTPKAYIEDNKFRKQIVELGYNITQSNKTKISLEAIGATNWPFNTNGFKFNFLDAPMASVESSIESVTLPIGGKDVEFTPALIKKIAITYAIIAVIILGIGYAVISSLYQAQEQVQEKLASDIAEIEKTLDSKPKETGITESEFLQKSYENNVNFKKSYAAIAREIPSMLWIEEMQMADNSKLYMAGRSYRMDDILNYYDSLNKLGKFPDLKISVLKISNSEISPLVKADMAEETTYEFAFGQSFYTDPNAVALPEAGAEGEKKEGGDSAVPPPPGGEAESVPPPVPPAPDSIPKQDK